jgi:hypothetical protein
VAAVGFEAVLGEGGHRGQPGWPGRGEAVAVVEQGGAEGDRHGEPVGRVVVAEQAAVGRRIVDLDRGDAAALGQPRGAVGEFLQPFDQFALGRDDRVEGDEGGVGLARGQDPALVVTLEGAAGGKFIGEGALRRLGRGRRRARRPGGDLGADAEADRARAQHRGGAAEELATIDRLHRLPPMLGGAS